jgi:hypothetical protein
MNEQHKNLGVLVDIRYPGFVDFAFFDYTIVRFNGMLARRPLLL